MISKPEKALQRELKKRKISFKSQHKINGHKIDIFIKPNICVEVDGRIFHNYPFGTDKDLREAQWLSAHGYIVLRFWDTEVNNDMEYVLERILSRIPMKQSMWNDNGKLFNLYSMKPVKFQL